MTHAPELVPMVGDRRNQYLAHATGIDTVTASRRFAPLPALSRVVLLGLVISTIVGAIIAVGPLHDYGVSESTNGTDSGLYRAVAERVRGGEDFYSASVTEQLDRGYPTRPAMTVREPTLAYLVAVAGGWRHALLPLGALALFAGLILIRRLESIDSRRRFFLLSGFGVLIAFGPYVGPVQATQHECWAGLFIVLSLALRTPERVAWAVAWGLTACLVRELAAPYLVLMAIAALAERKHREARAWVAAGVIFAALYATHLWAVGRHTSAHDPASPGWFAREGLTHVLETIRSTTIAGAGPDALSVLVLFLGLLGWASVRSPFTHRVLAWTVFWVGTTMVVGRPENIAWGFIWTGPLIVGMVLTPGALRDLVVGGRRGPAQIEEENVIPNT